jgi:sugar-specific transcriptional regulator TrmB
MEISDEDFIQLSNLFNSLGIIEKGIERIYHYLLKNKRIENLKEVCKKYDLSQKRVYKIINVLSGMELVQVYDRPMKVNLATPILPLWQRIINQRIEELLNEFQDKKIKCESSFDLFVGTYNLKEDVAQEPIEFINFSFDNFEEIYYPLQAINACKIALGIRYANPLITSLQEKSMEDLPSHLRDSLISAMNKIKENIKKITIQAIFNNELVNELISSKEFSILSKHIETQHFEFKNIEVHITEESFSNFSLTDNELIQPSFDPTNKLMGSYISRNENIYQIFYDKFNEIFEKGIPLNQYLQETKDSPVNNLSEVQSFVLCLL